MPKAIGESSLSLAKLGQSRLTTARSVDGCGSYFQEGWFAVACGWL
jgi:hypothetical protein